jgi:hypothetical protein
VALALAFPNSFACILDPLAAMPPPNGKRKQGKGKGGNQRSSKQKMNWMQVHHDCYYLTP